MKNTFRIINLLILFFLISFVAFASPIRTLKGHLRKITFDSLDGTSKTNWSIELRNKSLVELRGTIPNSNLDGKFIKITGSNYRNIIYINSPRRIRELKTRIQRFNSFTQTGSKSYLLLKVQYDENGDQKISTNESTATKNLFKCGGTSRCNITLNTIYSVFKTSTHWDSNLYMGNANQVVKALSVNRASVGNLKLHEVVIDDNFYYSQNSNNYCNHTEIKNEALKKARSKGIDPDNYDLLGVFVPYNSNCPWAGTGTYGQFLIWGYPKRTDTIVHEIGHAMGLGHSYSEGQELSDYPLDPIDFMSYSKQQKGHLFINLPNLLSLNWVKEYELFYSYLLDYGESNAKVSKLTATEFPIVAGTKRGVAFVLNNRDGSGYYVSYRSNPPGYVGADSNGDYVNRIAIHRWSSSNKSYFVDSLTLGQKYETPYGGIKFLARESSNRVARIAIWRK